MGVRIGASHSKAIVNVAGRARLANGECWEESVDGGAIKFEMSSKEHRKEIDSRLSELQEVLYVNAVEAAKNERSGRES